MSNQSELDEILNKAMAVHIQNSVPLMPSSAKVVEVRLQYQEAIRRLILDWHNKQIEQAYSDGFRKASKGAFKSQQAAKREAVEEVLERLGVQIDYNKHDFGDMGEFIRIKYVDNLIEAERNKLKDEK